MEYPFQAQQLNKDIFETIYYNALKASAELAAKEGPYETYEGSPVSKVFLYKLSPFQLLMLSVLIFMFMMKISGSFILKFLCIEINS